jgi:hypothetical protein
MKPILRLVIFCQVIESGAKHCWQGRIISQARLRRANARTRQFDDDRPAWKPLPVAMALRSNASVFIDAILLLISR